MYLYNKVPLVRPPMILTKSGLNSEQVSFNKTLLHRKMHLSTETSGLNSEGDINFQWS